MPPRLALSACHLACIAGLDAVTWAAVHNATPDGWYVGRPYFDERHNRWEQYAFDPRETPVVGKRLRKRTVVGQTELHCVQEMARCLGELKAGRWPSRGAIGHWESRVVLGTVGES